ncbi:cytidine deaminase-like fold-containing protein [Roseateles sp. MS654]|uniref:two-partner secretion domain-containing protein n=1 Tax=Roseateles sp. MS654 TaxID=3412685 RepID=UPI003C2E7D08
MNRLQFRIVFNKQRGQLMAVAETALSHTKGGCSGESTGPSRRTMSSQDVVPPASRGPPALLALAAAFAMGAVVTLAPDAAAQVHADTSAPKQQQPTVVTSANGTVQVNIQTPSAAGVSRNSYSQFDVDKRGVILNNSRTDVGTQLGGFVQGNPWLAKGGARVILNEVNSSAPSQLKGYVEVAGQRAEVIIANPAGIQVDGGGFINASAAVLTTGAPRFNADGSIAGYGVQGGLIRVDGQGLDGSQTDYTALLARAVELNAGLWAKEARIQTGTQVMTVDAAGTGAGEALAPTGERPRYALDSTALGGIYAQRITLVGTEAGLGVRQAGQIVGGQLTLRSDGWLDNTGTVYAQESDANGSPALTVQSSEGVRNAGWLASRGSADVRAPQVNGEAGSVLAAGMTPDGALAGGGSLSLTASQSVKQAGQVLAADHLAVQAPSIDLGGAQLSAGATMRLSADGLLSTQAASVMAGALSISAHDVDLRGAQWLQLGAEALTLNFNGAMTADGARIASNGSALAISASVFSAMGASLEQYGTGALTVDGRTIHLTSAMLWSNGALSASAAQLTLDGASVQARSIALQAEGVLNQQRATLATSGTASLRGDRIDNRDGQVVADGGLIVQAGAELRNERGMLQAATGELVIGGRALVVNAAGTIAGGGDVRLDARQLDNADRGLISTARGLSVRADTLTNDGTLQAYGDAAIEAANALRNTGLVRAMGSASIDSTSVHHSGTIAAGGALAVRAGAIESSGALVAGLKVDGTIGTSGDLSLTAQRMLAQSGATLAAGSARLDGVELLMQSSQTQAASITAQAHGGDLRLDRATVIASAPLDLRAATTLNTEGARMSGGSIDIAAADWRHAGGDLAQTDVNGRLRSTIAGVLDNRAGAIAANGTGMTLSSQRLDNTEGRLVHAGTSVGELRIDTGVLTGSRGEIAGNGALTVHATGAVDLSQALTQFHRLTLDANALSLQGGKVLATGAIDLTAAQSLDNSAGLVEGGGPVTLRAATLNNRDGQIGGSGVTLRGGAVDNAGQGLIASSRALTVEVDRLDNAGQLRASGDAGVTVREALSNAGQILAGGEARVLAESFTHSGTLAAQGNVSVNTGLLSSTGALAAGLQSDNSVRDRGDLTVAARSLRQSGTSIAGGTLALAADAVDLQGSRTQAGAVSLQALTDLGLGQATVSAARQLTLSADGTLASQDAVLSGGAVSLTASQWNHAGGSLAQTDSVGTLRVQVSGLLHNQGGRIGANAQSATLMATTLDNREGEITHAGADAFSITADALMGAGGRLASQGHMALTVAGAATLDGAVTQARSLSLSAGSLSHRDGQLLSQGDATLSVAGALENTGSLYAQGTMTVTAGGVITHGGLMAAQGDLTVRGQRIASSGAFAAGLKPDNTMAASGELSLSAAQVLQQSGTAQAAGRATFDGASVLLQDSQTTAASVTMTARDGASRLERALVSVRDLLDLRSASTLITEGSRMSGTSVSVTAIDWRNAGGEISQTDEGGRFAATLGGLLDNRGGRIAGNGSAMTLSANAIDNTVGQIVHAGDPSGELRLDAVSLSGANGTIAGNGALAIRVEREANLGGGTTQADRITVMAGSLKTRDGELIARSSARLTVDGELDNSQGLLHGGLDLAVDAGALVNIDGQIGARDVTLMGGAVTSSGQSLIAAQGRLSVDVASLNNAGVMQAGGDATLRTLGTLQNNGAVRAQGHVQLRADTLDNSGSITAQGAITAEVREIAGHGAFAAGLNADGTLSPGGDLTLTATGALRHNGTLLAGGAVSLTGASLALQDSRVQAQRVTMAALNGDARLDRAAVMGGERLTLSAATTLDTSDAKLGAGAVSITATDWRHAGGNLAQSAADGELRVAVSQSLVNQGGAIAANAADVTLGAVRIDNRQGTVSHAGSGTLTLAAHQIDGTGGEVLAKGALVVRVQDAATLDGALTQARGITLDAGSLSHRGGQWLSMAGAMLNVQGALDNAGGLVQSVEDLAIAAATLDNRDGQIGGRAVGLSTSGRLSNGGQGLIASVRRLAIEAGQFDNGGNLQAQSTMDLTVRGAFVNTGAAYARGPLTITADAALTNAGMLAAQGALSAQAASIASTGGFVAGLNPDNTLSAQGDLSLRSSGSLQQSGQTVAAGALSVSGSTLQLQDARLQAQRAELSATAGDLGLNRTTLAVSRTLGVTAAGTIDTGAATVSGDTIALTAQRWTNIDGTVTQTGASGAFSATLQSSIDNMRGEIAAAGRSLTLASASLDNSQGRILHGGAETMRIETGSLTGVGGEILGAQAVAVLVTGAADLSQARTQGAQLTLQADSLGHQGGQMLSAGDAQLGVNGAIDNTGGSISAGGDLSGQAASLLNSGGQVGGRAVALTLGTLNNGAWGQIQARTTLDIGAGQATNAGALQSGADARLIVSGDLINTGSVYAQGNGTVNAGNAFVNTGTAGALGALTVEAGTLSGNGTLAAGLRADNTLAAQGDLTVRTTGALQSGGAMLGAGRMTLTGRELQLQDGRLQAGQITLTSTAGELRLDRAIVASANDLMLASAGLLSTDVATMSGANVGLSAADWRNVGGSIAQIGATGQLTATVGGQIGNTDGRIQAAGSGLRLQAQAVDNVRGQIVQAGSGATVLTTGTLDGSAGQILGNGAVTIAATGTVTLAGAQTQGQGVSVAGSSLDHRGGNLVSTGAAQLNIDGAIDNRGGTVASAGALDVSSGSLVNGSNGLLQSDSTLQATVAGVVDNQGGRLRSGAAMTVNAASVDNRAGTVGSDGALTVTTGGVLQNAGGSLLAQQGVRVDAATIGNQQGRIASLQGGATLRAQGAVDNTQGTIQAAQLAEVVSTSLINARGEVSGATVALDTRGQALENSGGRVLATQSLTVNSGLLENRGGLLQSLGALSVQTNGAALNNALDAAVATPTGIHAQGAVTLNAGSLRNEQGISAGTTAQVNVGQMTNRAELSAAALGLTVGGTLDNQGGRLIGAQSLEASAQQVLNQGGLIYGGSTLNLTAAGRIDNTSTSGSGLGIQGGNVNLRAQQLDNIGGQVLASGNLGLTIAQSLNNASGALGASGMQTIGDGATVSALSLNNAGGRIWSGDAMGLNLGELAGGVGGQVSSGGAMSVKLLGDFSYGAGSQFQSTGNLVLDVSGNFSNQGTLRSGGALSITASNIDNGTGGELSGAMALLTAQNGRIVNRGLIDGDGVMLTADRLLNLGTGRIFGGDVVIDGGQLLNGSEGGVSAVIAGRRSVDAQLTRDVSNTDGALIFADGDLRLAGASLLNENATIEASRALDIEMSGGIVNRTVLPGVGMGQVSGSSGFTTTFLESKAFIRSGGDMRLVGTTLLNSGATIEGRGNLLMQASQIDNLNPYLMWGNYVPATDGELSVLYTNGEGGAVEDIVIFLRGRTAQEALDDFRRASRTRRIISWTQFGGNDAGAPVTQTLAGKVIVGGQLVVQGASSITNDMSQVVGMTGVAITGGQVNNVEHNVTATDAQGVVHTVRLTLPSGAQSFIPASQAPADRQQAGAVSSGGGASSQQAQSGNRANAGGGSSLGGMFGRVLQQVRQGSAAQSGAQANAQWRSGDQGAALAIDVGDGAGGAGAVQASQRNGASATERVVTAAQVGDAGASVQAELRQERSGTAVQAGGAPAVRGAQVTTRWRDGDAAAAQAVQSAQVGAVAQTVRGGARQGLVAAAQAVRSATGMQPVTPSSKVVAWAASANPGQTLRGSGATFNGKALALSVRANLTLPSNSLFKTRSEPTSRYLVETDPRFANYRDWLSSDFLLESMAVDPSVTQKRLGDGFYEQRLVREQIGQLTGTGYLSGYADDEAMYRALLTNGATFAKSHQLVPGVALTAEQMTQLTTDLVWLVEQTVTLADGTAQRVLVPQVYLVPREGDLLPSGSLIAGGRVEMALSGNFTNGGDVRGGVVDIQAQNIANTGDMRGTTLALTARQDLRNVGGQLSATGDMTLAAGRDIVMESTTASGGRQRGNVKTSATVLDQVASLSAGGVLVVQAGRDATLQAVKITQGGVDGAGADGGVLVQAGRDLTLSTVTTASSREQVWNANNFKKENQRQDVGTEVKAEGAIVLKAGQDLSATAAQIASGQGALTLNAGRDVELLAGEANRVVEEMTQKTKKSLFKKKTVTTYSKSDDTTAIGTTVSGDTVNIVAGRDITLAAAQAVSDNGTKLIAERDIAIDGVTNSVDTEQFKKTVKSGLFSGGGIGVTIGKQQLSQATKSTQETNQGSMVGSVNGDVDILAGGEYRQVGSEVQAPSGNVNIQARSIEIVEARNQSAQDSETKFRQGGVTLSLSAPGVDAALGAIKAGEHVTQTQDDRMKALAAATAISKAKQAVEEIQKFMEAAKAQEQNQGVRISLTVGSSQSKSTQHNEADQAAGSAILAGRDLNLVATGGGEDSNVTVRGSSLMGQDVLIKADNAVILLAAKNTSEQHSKDNSSSASVGIGVTLGQKNSLGFTVSASVSKGSADGTDTNFTTTQVTGGSSVKLQSGGNATLQGAVVTAPKVVADVGGDLKIESLQDTAKFDSKSISAGGSATFGYGASASGNFSQTKVNADYAAVGEQAGIRAGDGGFVVSVKGNTDLKGGAITSSQAAIDAGRNSFSTGTLTTSDIDNRSQFKATAVMVSAGTGGGMAGAFKDSGDERSTTRSTISAGSTTITSGDAASQTVLEKLDRGATNDATAGKLAQGWDGQKLAQQGKLNAQIVAEFGAQAAKGVAGQLDKKAQQLRADGKIEDAKKYEEGGEYRVAAHAVIGAITGDLSGALGAAASAKVADQLNSLQETLRGRLDKAGLGGEEQKNDWATALSKLASGALATGIGAIAGGGFDGAAAGLNQDYNNRQMHPTEAQLIRRNAAAFAKQLNGGRAPTDAEVAAAEQRLVSSTLNQIDSAFDKRIATDDPAAQAFLAKVASDNGGILADGSKLFDARGASSFDNHTINYQFLPYVSPLYNELNSSNIKGVVKSVGGAYIAYNDVATDPKLLGLTQTEIVQVLNVGKALKEQARTPQETLAVISGNSQLTERMFSGGKAIPGDGTKFTDRMIGTMGENALEGLPSEGGTAITPTRKPLPLAAVREELPTTTGNRVNSAPRVTAEATVNGETFNDVNPGHRPPVAANADEPTMIAPQVAKRELEGGKVLPNGNMETAHAEIATMQKAMNAQKTQDGRMVMNVEGMDVCGHCQRDLATAAQEAGLTYLEVYAKSNSSQRDKVYYWQPGMPKLKEKK